PRGGRGCHRARRLRLREGVPRRAVLPRGAAHAYRADQPGDGPQLHRRARPRPAAELLMRGLYFEEFEVGRVYKHAFSRTITEMDNVMFTSLTMNVQPLHLDEEFAKTTIH